MIKVVFTQKLREYLNKKEITKRTLCKALRGLDRIEQDADYRERINFVEEESWIVTAFSWEDTHEGHKFWKRIYYAENKKIELKGKKK